MAARSDQVGRNQIDIDPRARVMRPEPIPTVGALAVHMYAVAGQFLLIISEPVIGVDHAFATGKVEKVGTVALNQRVIDRRDIGGPSRWSPTTGRRSG